MWFTFLPSLLVAVWIALGDDGSIPSLIVPFTFPLLLAGWALGRRPGGPDLWWVVGVLAISLLGVVTAWLWYPVDPYREEPAYLDALFRLVAAATAGYFICGLSFFLRRRWLAARR